MASESAHPAETARKALTPHHSQYRDVFSPSCLAELQAKLNLSQGKAFFITHPFYLENTWYDGHFKDAVQGRISDKPLTTFLQKLKGTVPKLIEHGMPIILLQETVFLGENRLEDNERIKAQFNQLCQYLGQLSIDPQSLFVIYTEREGPLPLKSETEEEDGWQTIITRRMNDLKGAGLTIGIVAGREFESSEGNHNEFYASADDKDYGWGRTADKLHGGFLLKDYFSQARADRPGPHPLQVIRPDQCVGEMLRILALNGIRPVISTFTYPDHIRPSSNYTQCQHEGKTVYSPNC